MPDVVKVKTYRLNSGMHTGPDEHGKDQTWVGTRVSPVEFRTGQDLSQMCGPDPRAFKFTEVVPEIAEVFGSPVTDVL